MPKVCRSCCTAASCGRLCFPVTSSCAPNPGISGATVAVSKSGVAVGTAVTSSQVASITKVTGGSGFTSAPAISFTGGGGSGAAGFATISVGQIASITLTSGGGGYTSAPTISYTGGGGTGAQFNAVLGVQACIPITSSGLSGQYTYVISAPGYTTKTGSLGSVSCSTSTQPTTSTAVQLDPSSANVKVCVATGCMGGTCGAAGSGGNGLSGASATIGAAAGTTDSLGNFTASQATGATVTVSAVLGPRFATSSTSVTVLKCGNNAVLTLNPAAGYKCAGNCPYPTSTTLTLSDSVWGGCALTWKDNTDPTNWLGLTAWVGTGPTVNFPGCTACPTPASVAISYGWTGSTLYMGYITNASTGCPCSTSGCNPPPVGQVLSYNQDSLACPPSLLVHFTIPAQGIYCVAGGTITITE